MRIKSLEMVGFKSFAPRTAIDVSNNMTCFVGPNGCGKSNVVDAVRWVLGEQKVSALRGDRMCDVIFKGNASGRRAPMNFAEVSLTISNEDNTLSVEFDEVVVTRRLYRSGESEYLLNRSPVRLKDIRNLFMNTGIGLEAYSIMEQGKIDSILEANPRDRRVIFEEAAGISLFKAQKLEAERKLDRTTANLLRLGDIIDELEKRIRSLKNQAGRAKSYLQLSDRIKVLKKKYYLRLYGELVGRMDDLKKAESETSREEEVLNGKIAAARKERDELESNMTAVRENTITKRSRLAELKTALEESDARIAMVDKRLVEIRSELDRNGKQKQDLHKHRAEQKKRRAEVVGLLDELLVDEKSLRDEEHRYKDLLDQATGMLKESRGRVESLENGLVDLSRKEVEIGNKMTEAGARSKGLHSARARLVFKQNGIAAELFRCRVERAGLINDLEKKAEFQKELASHLESGRSKLRTMEEGLQELDDEIRILEDDLVKGDSRIDLLQSLVSSREGLDAGAKAVMAEAGREGNEFGFVRGVLGECLEVDIKYSRALESVLGEMAEAVIVSNHDEAGRVFEFLKEKKIGGGVVLALSGFGPSKNGLNENGLKKEHGPSTGPAGGTSLSRVVRCSSELKPLVNGLLSGFFLFEKGSIISEDLDAGIWRVNLQGDIFRSGVLRMGGGSRESSVISRRSELAALEKERDGIKERLDVLRRRRSSIEENVQVVHISNEDLAMRLDNQEFEVAGLNAESSKILDRMERLSQELRVNLDECFDAEKSLSSLYLELNELDKEKTWILDEIEQRSRKLDLVRIEVEGKAGEKTRFEKLLNGLEIKLVEQKAKKEGLNKEIGFLEKNLDESSRRLTEADEEKERLRSDFRDNTSEIDRLKVRTEKIASERSGLVSDIDGKEKHLDDLKGDLEEKESIVRRVEETAGAIKEKLDNLRMEIREVDVREQGLVERSREELDINLETAADRDEEDFDPAAMDREIQEIRQKIARLGNVNLEAVSELDKVVERHGHLAEQRDDLVEARKSLQNLITELNKESRQRFTETFELVKSHFNGIFRKLFHGGRADINLKEGEDVLESGIEIMAGPPRKDVRSISLLSGGERSLTAVALLFALFKARPSPFCILDEVDAALDETNIERFCSLLGEFRKNSQFMIVTHSKRTMAHADVLYGVTMEEGGVSKFISMKLEEFQGMVA